MDGARFDRLAQRLALAGEHASGRRGLLAVALAVLTGPSGVPHASAATTRRPGHERGGASREGPCGNGSAKANRCKRHRQCCTGFCRKRKGGRGRCRCRTLGQSCREDRNCCPSGGQPMSCQSGICQSCEVCPSGCAFTTVQAAVSAASPGATIRVCAGTYVGDVLITQNLTLVGVGDGADPATSTILQGTGAGSVVTVSAGTVSLQSLRITGGDAPTGAGILNSIGSSLTVIASTITGNAANGPGGGIGNNGTLALVTSTISGNQASPGAGINNTGTLTLLDSTVTGNTSGLGAGIYNELGTVALTGSTISGNESLQGGGIFNLATATLTASTVSGNIGNNVGGGILNDGAATLTLDAASQVRQNAAPDGQGGGIFNDGGAVNLASDQIVTNNTGGNCAPVNTIPNCIG